MNRTIEQAEADLAAAKAAYQEELRQDCERPEGSGAQERRREEHHQELKEAVHRCEQTLAESRKENATMTVIEQNWQDGYLNGWQDQSALPNPPMPTIPAFPGGIPSGHSDSGQYAYDLGYAAGVKARTVVQAGI